MYPYGVGCGYPPVGGFGCGCGYGSSWLWIIIIVFIVLFICRGGFFRPC